MDISELNVYYKFEDVILIHLIYVKIATVVRKI